MAAIVIPFLRARAMKNGIVRWYWIPSAALARVGWEIVALGSDQSAACKAAAAINADVDRWKAGGQPQAKGKARRIEPHRQPQTTGGLIRAYKASPAWAKLSDNTRRTYTFQLKVIDGWAGDVPAAAVDRKRVQRFKDGLMAPNGHGQVQHTRAAGIMRCGRTLFQWGVNEGLLPANPFEKPGMEQPPPRHQVASPEARAALIAGALTPYIANGTDYAPDDGVAAGIALAFVTGQREGDLLAMQRSQWVELSPVKVRDRAVWQALVDASPDGRPMALRIRQGKTKVWVEIPVVGTERVIMDQAIARSKAAGCTTILIDERAGNPWQGRTGQTRFQRRFAEARDRVIAAARKAENEALAGELADLQFRDLRRTCVVYLGELGLDDQAISAITGHKLESIKKILETYMPRTTAMAARAISIAHARPVANPTEAEAR